jgi:hypothetical protein
MPRCLQPAAWCYSGESGVSGWRGGVGDDRLGEYGWELAAVAASDVRGVDAVAVGRGADVQHVRRS